MKVLAMPVTPFWPIGTRVEFQGCQVDGLITVRITEAGVDVLARYDPADPVHQAIIAAIQKKEIGTLEVILPREKGLLSIVGHVRGEAAIPQAAPLSLSFTVLGVVTHRGEIPLPTQVAQQKI